MRLARNSCILKQEEERKESDCGKIADRRDVRIVVLLQNVRRGRRAQGAGADHREVQPALRALLRLVYGGGSGHLVRGLRDASAPPSHGGRSHAHHPHRRRTVCSPQPSRHLQVDGGLGSVGGCLLERNPRHRRADRVSGEAGRAHQRQLRRLPGAVAR